MLGQVSQSESMGSEQVITGRTVTCLPVTAISLRCDHCSNDSHCLRNILPGDTENPSHWPLRIKMAPGNTLCTVLTQLRCSEFFCDNFITNLSDTVKVKEFWKSACITVTVYGLKLPTTQWGQPQSRKKNSPSFPGFSTPLITLFQRLSQKVYPTTMWADAQRDGCPAEYRWCPLRKFRNSIPCTMPQALADACCWSAMQWHCQYMRTQDLDVTWILHQAKFC